MGDVHVFALTGNAWLQPPLGWRIVPYAGGGVGPALQIREGRSSITRSDFDQISGVFARQLGAGVRIGISERLSAISVCAISVCAISVCAISRLATSSSSSSLRASFSPWLRSSA